MLHQGVLWMSLAEASFMRPTENGASDRPVATQVSTYLVAVFLALVILPVGIDVGPLYLTGVRIWLIALIIPLTVNLLRGFYGRLLLTDILFTLHFVWIIIALWVNNPDKVVQNAGSTGIEFLGGYLLGRACIRDSKSFLALVRTLIAIVIICSPLALIEAITGTSLLIGFVDKLPLISAPPDLAIDRRLGLERVQLGFEHPIHWGLFCSVSTALCFVGLNQQSSLAVRLILTTLICLSGALAFSSGAILAVALQLGLIVWAVIFRNNTKRWIILLALGVVCYVIVDVISNRSPLQVFMSYATFSAESAYWRSTIFEWGMVNIWAHPVFGLGLGDWARPVWMHISSVDNFWLLVAMRYGLPGFGLLAFGYIHALWQIGHRDLQTDTTPWSLRRAWMFCFVGLTFTLATVHVWGSIYALVFFLFGSGMWLVPKSGRSEKDAPEAALNRARKPFWRPQNQQLNRALRPALFNRGIKPNFTSQKHPTSGLPKYHQDPKHISYRQTACLDRTQARSNHFAQSSPNQAP